MSLRLDLQLARSRNSVQSEREFIIRNRLLMLFALKKHRSSAAVGPVQSNRFSVLLR